MRYKLWLLNIGLLFASIAVTFLLFEIGIRVVFDPVDYLLPELVADEYLNHRIEPGSGGHDELGFRNYAVPTQANIVAIGDSQTYGISAHSYESWPAVVAELSGETTYNMALGGYGPLHYLHLLREYAMALRPEKVIVGIYFGNDIQDVTNLAYSNENWKKYRSATIELEIDPASLVSGLEKRNKDKFLGGLRSYLAGHSVLYRLVTESPILDRFRFVNTRSAVEKGMYVYTEGDFTTIFTPRRRLEALALGDPLIRMAVDTTKSVMLEMQEFSVANDFDLYFLLIPTKESVYSKRLAKQDALKDDPDMAALIAAEASIREELTDFMLNANMSVIDPLPALQEAAEKDAVYPSYGDHPNAAGYRIIAQQVVARIQ